MKRKYIASKILSILISGFILSSCATILGGKYNTLVFSEESLPAADVYLDDEFIGNAPGKIKVQKGKLQHGTVLTLKAEGYLEKEYLILRKQSKPYSIVDLLLGGIPLAVDYTTGNIYRPSPRKFTYILETDGLANE